MAFAVLVCGMADKGLGEIDRRDDGLGLYVDPAQPLRRLRCLAMPLRIVHRLPLLAPHAISSRAGRPALSQTCRRGGNAQGPEIVDGGQRGADCAGNNPADPSGGWRSRATARWTW